MGEPVVALLVLVAVALVGCTTIPPPVAEAAELVDPGSSAPLSFSGGVGCGFKSQAFSRPATNSRLAARACARLEPQNVPTAQAYHRSIGNRRKRKHAEVEISRSGAKKLRFRSDALLFHVLLERLWRNRGVTTINVHQGADALGLGLEARNAVCACPRIDNLPERCSKSVIPPLPKSPARAFRGNCRGEVVDDRW